MRAIILSTSDPHPGLQGLPSHHKQGHNPANSTSGAGGCPPLQTERVELSSQTESYALFFSPRDSSNVYFKLLLCARNTGDKHPTHGPRV